MHLNLFEKGQIVAYHDCGLSGTLIAKKINRNKRTVNKFLKSWKETGEYERKEGSGRKRILTENQTNDIMNFVKRRRTASAKQIKNELDLNCSDQTIRNRLHEKGFWSHFQSIQLSQYKII